MNNFTLIQSSPTSPILYTSFIYFQAVFSLTKPVFQSLITVSYDHLKFRWWSFKILPWVFCISLDLYCLMVNLSGSHRLLLLFYLNDPSCNWKIIYYISINFIHDFAHDLVILIFMKNVQQVFFLPYY